MAVSREPILKRCKALGISPMVMGVAKETKRDPNANKRKKVSEYGLQLREKQKLKFIYGMLEKQFHHYFELAEKMEGQAGTNLLSLLETILDNVVFRIKVGDVISLRENSKKSVKFKEIVEATNGRIVPTWLDMNKEALSAKVSRLPAKEDLDFEIEEHLIVELYSK